MEKDNSLQLELFGQGNEPAISRSQGRANSLFSFIWGYEKAILLIIGVAVAWIIAFSLGVERGKGLSAGQEEKETLRIESSQKSSMQQPAVKAPALPAIKAQAQATVLKSPVEAARPATGYAIQLASFKSKSLAQKEAESLRKKGFSALILPKGSYSIVCVGGFNTKEAAQSLLTELRKRFKDCYIRRL